MLCAWLDSWSGARDVINAMNGHGYDVRLSQSPFGWWRSSAARRSAPSQSGSDRATTSPRPGGRFGLRRWIRSGEIGPRRFDQAWPSASHHEPPTSPSWRSRRRRPAARRRRPRARRSQNGRRRHPGGSATRSRSLVTGRTADSTGHPGRQEHRSDRDGDPRGGGPAALMDRRGASTLPSRRNGGTPGSAAATLIRLGRAHEASLRVGLRRP
jgi:hypothetical protein